MIKNNYTLATVYEAPAMAMYDIRAELGFGLSDGSIIEQVGGRSEEEEWL